MHHWNSPTGLYSTYRNNPHPACKLSSLFSYFQINTCCLSIRLISQPLAPLHVIFKCSCFFIYQLQLASDYACLPPVLIFCLFLFLILCVDCILCSGSIPRQLPSEQVCLRKTFNWRIFCGSNVCAQTLCIFKAHTIFNVRTPQQVHFLMTIWPSSWSFAICADMSEGLQHGTSTRQINYSVWCSGEYLVYVVRLCTLVI